MRTPREACPPCGSRVYKRNGRMHTGKQNHRCKVCGRAFVLTPENPVLTEEQRMLIEAFSWREFRCVGSAAPWVLVSSGSCNL